MLQETGVIAWTSAGQSDVGQVRSLNEDSFLDNAGNGLWVVADGMGGHDSGEVASRMVCDSLALVDGNQDLIAALESAEEALQTVNARLISMSGGKESKNIIGSTVICLIARQRHAICLWAGDSRLYRLRQEQLQQLSLDHSLSEELARHSAGTEKVNSNIITRAVGAAAHLYLDVETVDLIPGDRYLLCSDGVTNEVPDQLLETILLAGDADKSCKEIVTTALKRGGRDNITAVVIDI